MKKYLSILFVMMISMAMLLTSCGGTMGIADVDENGKSMVVEAENAGADMEVLSGTIVTEEDEAISISSTLESGSINLDFISTEGLDNIDEIPDADEIDADPVFTASVSGTESQTFTVGAGEFLVKATATEKATGTISIEVIKIDGSDADGEDKGDWETAESTDDAAEKAGLDMFIVDPEGLSLGEVTNADYSYQEGAAQAHYGVAAVELYVNKGLNEKFNGDVSFDTKEYAHEWTQNIKGLEVKCYGNREGEATKTIWTLENNDFAICAYGAGGDDDFGLSADDVSSLVNSIQ